MNSVYTDKLSKCKSGSDTIGIAPAVVELTLYTAVGHVSYTTDNSAISQTISESYDEQLTNSIPTLIYPQDSIAQTSAFSNSVKTLIAESEGLFPATVYSDSFLIGYMANKPTRFFLFTYHTGFSRTSAMSIIGKSIAVISAILTLGRHVLVPIEGSSRLHTCILDKTDNSIIFIKNNYQEYNPATDYAIEQHVTNNLKYFLSDKRDGE